MLKKLKCALITLALASLVTGSAVFSACTVKTNHPQAKITISFNNVTYNIEYKLYRNMYPQTVKHFIELADNGFYNDMIVHDYKSSDWFTGAYSYAEGDSLYAPSTYKEYLEKYSKENEYYDDLFKAGKLTSTVYTSVSYANDKKTVSDENALPTLIGEFSDNQHIIEKNALTAKLGALKMFYYDKGTSNQQATIKNWAGQILTQNYKYNCATSVFAMQVSGSSSYNASKYCVFAELKNDSARAELDKLIEAIDDYSNDFGSGFTSSVNNVRVDTRDEFAVDKDVEVSFTMTSAPIVIKSVKITKY